MLPALITNSAWLDDEPVTLRQLGVGLFDAGLRSVQVVPADRAKEQSLPVAGQVLWEPTRSDRANAKALAGVSDELAERGVDLVHALCGAVWGGALKAGGSLGVPAVLGVNGLADAEQAAKLARKLDPERVAFACATAPLRERVEAALPEGFLVADVPPGVHLGEPPDHDPAEALCVVVNTDGRPDDAMQGFLAALRAAADALPGAQFFFDSRSRDTHPLWRAIDKLGLAPHCTITPRRMGQRSILLRADALAHPQPLGRAQPVTLRAMAHARPVLAHHDPALDYLLPGQTAHVIHDPEPDAWVDPIIQLSLKPDEARTLGRSARDWVADHRLAATQVDKLLHLYRSLTGETLPFAG